MTALSRRAAVTSLFAAVSAVLVGASAALADISGTDLPDHKRPGGPKARPKGGNLKGLLTDEDREINRRCIDKTMNEAPIGKAWKWSNPKSGNSGSVTPTSKAARHGDQVCRSFNETITLKDGRSETINSRACRKPDGSWSIAA